MAALLNHVGGIEVTTEGEEDGGNANRHSMLQQEMVHYHSALVHWPDLSPGPDQPQGQLKPP